MGEWCCRVYLVGISAVVVLLSAAEAEALSTDGLALLALKSAVSADPTGALDTWRDSDADPCGWVGVTCGDGRVTDLALPNRSLSGYLPSELSLLSALSSLSLPFNRLSGSIPAALAALRALSALDLSHNLLSGPIPPAIGALASLSRLDLSSNLLSGSLPPAIAALPRLSGVLNLSCNRFSGPIPPEFGSIPVDVSLDLRRNNLSGEIPQVGSLLNQGPTAFAGNPGLCGFPLKIPCPGSKQDPRIPQPSPSWNPSSATADPVRAERQHRRPGVAVPILAGVVIAALASIVVLQLHFRRRRRGLVGDGKESKKGKGGAADGALAEDRRDAHEGEVFVAVDEGFGLELEELLRASAYVVGKSRGGIVYKVVTGKGPAVAVRRLSEGDDGESGGGDEWRRRRGFESEAMAIGRARHPNVVRLLAYYYAPDEKLLVYDYIPNGTLHAALHGGPLNPTAVALPWAARLSIVQGAARGLAHLHECGPRKYAHGSVRSSKILLDDELRPYVSGFGVARLVSAAQKSTRSSSAKSLGPAACAQPLPYVAPEARAAAAAATQKGDVYAFGIVLLEAVTGRAPGADEGEGVDLEGWVRRAFKEERPLSEVVDPALLHEVHAKKQVLAVFHVALGCTEVDPELRPRMRAVSESLDRIG
ncbi:putative inactive leucine-rich repeat receptor-like protein kinase [Ananas comosus]|uniref:Putative inactive leucine-rich repeat receptor-like protein kinase n=1 Tax=Ananas comosus TaxID=4615 RepID=A0A199VTZ1_ANACO|nr:putative inactive leucine-rich repeat receptor-like protein kinase [Ananas comosus]